MIAQASKGDPLATLKHHLQLVVLNVAFWIHKKLDPELLPRLPKWTLRHTETPWQWRTDGACGLQLVVPNFAFWIHKKLAPKWLNSVHHVHASITLPPNGATLLSRSLPWDLSPSYFPRFPVRPACRRWSAAPPAAKFKLNENPSIGDAFGKKHCNLREPHPPAFPGSSRPSGPIGTGVRLRSCGRSWRKRRRHSAAASRSWRFKLLHCKGPPWDCHGSRWKGETMELDEFKWVGRRSYYRPL